MAADPTARTEASSRFQLIDALRGLAALAVVFFHVQVALDRGQQPWMPEPLKALFREGHYGVNVFFVLSGFVIAFSVRNGAWTPSFLGRFALRRSIRLDPPYWSAIVLEIGLTLAGLALIPSLATPLPGGAQVLAHLAYLQEFLGFEHVIPIFWTLCYEFQFYLALVGLLVLGAAVARFLRRRAATAVMAAIFAGLFVLSIAVHHGHLSGVPRGLALDRWHEFFVGVLAWWVVAGLAPIWLLPGAWAVVALLAGRPDARVELGIMSLISALCVLSVRSPRVDALARWRPLQALGALSYTLYLYHASIGWRVVSVAQRFAGASLPAGIGLVTWIAAIAAALTAAVIGRRLLEQPSIELARQVRLPVRTGEPIAPFTG